MLFIYFVLHTWSRFGCSIIENDKIFVYYVQFIFFIFWCMYRDLCVSLLRCLSLPLQSQTLCFEIPIERLLAICDCGSG